MSERLSQEKVDELFKEIMSNNDWKKEAQPVDHGDADDTTLTPQEFYRHLIKQGYSDEEIAEIFDLTVIETEEGK